MDEAAEKAKARMLDSANRLKEQMADRCWTCHTDPCYCGALDEYRRKYYGKAPEPIHEWLRDDETYRQKETRVTNPKTGGEKGSKPAQVGAVDPASLLELASVAGMGSDKYARYNFARGVDWSLFFDAMMRHSLAFWGGEDMDPESGLPHMAHAAWHACALLTMMRRHRDLDDRFPR